MMISFTVVLFMLCRVPGPYSIDYRGDHNVFQPGNQSWCGTLHRVPVLQAELVLIPEKRACMLSKK
jgi:hypothetical protein